MAKKKWIRKTANRAFQALPISASMALSTLADNTVLSAAITALADDFWVNSAHLTWTLRDLTPGEGPIHIGMANLDLSVAEIKSAISATVTSRSDIIEREEARRPVRRVGSFDGLSEAQTLNNGNPIKTIVKMYLAEGIEMGIWALNASAATLTTGAIVEVIGMLYGNWK